MKISDKQSTSCPPAAKFLFSTHHPVHSLHPTRIRIGNLCWLAYPALLTPQAYAILEHPDAFLLNQAQLLKHARGSIVGRAYGLILKRYNFRRLFALLKNLFRRGKGILEFHRASRLLQAGIPTVVPLAAADYRRSGILWHSYLLLQEIPAARTLNEWKGNPYEAAHALARLLAQLHKQGFYHRDLKSTNLLFDPQGRWYLIDLDGLHIRRRISLRRAVKDLQRLAQTAKEIPSCTPAVQRAFLRVYCRERGLHPHQLRTPLLFKCCRSFFS